ncbi:unnamed protein product, partial [Cyprideis torosa]
SGLRLMNSLLLFDPKRRISAETAFNDRWFEEAPYPTPESQFPTWPAKSEGGIAAVKKGASPKPPSGGGAYYRQMHGDDDDEPQSSSAGGIFGAVGRAPQGAGWGLKF